MSSDNSNSNNNNNNSSKPPSPPPADMQRHRRGSLTASNPFSQLFTRSNSVATAAGTPVFPSAITSAAIQEQQRRRLSLSTAATLGITGTSPTSASSLARRASMSTNSDWDENAIEEEDAPPFTARTAPVSPFNRRVSFGTAAAMRRPGGSSPGSGNGRHTVQFPYDTASPSSGGRRGINAVLPTPPPGSAAPAPALASATSLKTVNSSTAQTQPGSTGAAADSTAIPRTRPRATSDLFSPTRSDQGFNWSEQLRSRAESSVATGSRPSFSFASGLTGSPPRPGMTSPGSTHDRARSVSEMPAPPAQTPKPRSPRGDPRPKPDHFQERILKGDFYMD